VSASINKYNLFISASARLLLFNLAKICRDTILQDCESCKKQ